ncbi:MAG: sulfatase activating formylglycine-generating enzyme [Bradymonadia bacterium]|jgi:formylglycine-generating enzyme required for sulfatase activity
MRVCDGDYKCSAVTFRGLDCTGYRLPTEAEWEYAARAETKAARYGELDEIAWYDANAKNETHPVRKKSPNRWHLADMLGNVGEWTQDAYDETLAGGTDPLGADWSANGRVLRGCGFDYTARLCRAAFSFESSADADAIAPSVQGAPAGDCLP